MKLSELEGNFVGRFDTANHGFFEHRDIEAAQGVLFICPKCQKHSVLVWFKTPRNNLPMVPTNAFPENDERWEFSGTSIDDLTLTPSVDLSKITLENPASLNRCYWHGSVTNGEAN